MHGLNIIKRLNQQEQERVNQILEETRRNPISEQLDRHYREYLEQRAARAQGDSHVV
jgi:5'-deoxynucleotidase YfbR-like HD superfamily hydrolase